MAMMHMGFVHAALVDAAGDTQGKAGSSWDRERHYAQSVVETMSAFDGKWNREVEATPPKTPPTRPGGGWGIAVRLALGLFGRGRSFASSR